jgi:hypothetical protein
MTPRNVHRLRALGVSARVFAQITNLDKSTVAGWDKLRGEPLWVELLVSAWERSPQALEDAMNQARNRIEGFA